MGIHLRNLLENITAHGFNHLVRREDGTYNTWLVILWAGAIFMAFFASGYYIVSSVKEADSNPISTTSGYTNLQVRAFYTALVLV